MGVFCYIWGKRILLPMSKTLLTELFEKPNAEFSKHISDPQNVRILFSGKFGIGKTTFINQYFEGKEDEYVKIHLFPVNYSIASNEDIIDLIKYDILMELIREGATFFETEIPKEDLLYGFSETNALEIVKIFVNCIPKAGKDIASVIKELENLHKSFQKYCSEAIDDEGKTTLKFLEKVQNEKGSIYEQTAVTCLIKEKIDFLKQNGDTPKKIVLVIDDLDRIDPDHIFRLFNVFAAQFDSSEGDSYSNKFGFDRVVFVCDVENIRSIFKHKYGADTDFGGYIDKFFSKEVFGFDNIFDTRKVVNLILSKMSFSAIRNEVSSNSVVDQTEELLTIFIETALHLRIVTLRSLCKYLEEQIVIPKNKFIFFEMESKKEINYGFLIACRIIKSILGNELEALRILEKNQDNTKVPQNASYLERVITLAFTPLFIYQNKMIPDFYSGASIKIDNKNVTKETQTSKVNISGLQNPQTIEFNINVLRVFFEGILFIIELDKSNGKLVYNASKDLSFNFS